MRGTITETYRFLLAVLAVFVGFSLVPVSLLHAATWYVKADGLGDVPTIADAIDAAAPGDTILLADGTFSGDGNRDVDVDNQAVIICSESGDPTLCIIDCGGSASENHLALDFRVDAPTEAVLAGVTIRGGYASGAGGIYVSDSSVGGGVVTIANCIFTDNWSQWDGAVVVVNECQLNLAGCQFTGNTGGLGAALGLCAGSTTIAVGCTFTDNTATYSGGAVDLGCMGEAYATFVNCNFSHNTATQNGGAIYTTSGTPVLMGCRFDGNSADWQGGALYLGGGLSMTSCVSIKNTAGGSGSSVFAYAAVPISIASCSFVADSIGGSALEFPANAAPELDHTLIAFAVGAAAIYCNPPAGALVLTCCDIFGNQYGDWTGCIAGQAGVNDNMSQDPRFCDIPTGDVSVEDCSPCLAANNDCGQDIGAQGEGCLCGAATVPTTWGAIKTLYK